MVRALYLGLALLFLASGAIGERTDTDRVAIQKGSFQGRIKKMPPEVIARLGRLATERFCSCYASKIADTIPQTQIDAMLKENTQDDIPGYAETMKSAWRVCERHYLRRWG
jgi:hypothetical protein